MTKSILQDGPQLLIPQAIPITAGVEVVGSEKFRDVFKERVLGGRIVQIDIVDMVLGGLLHKHLPGFEGSSVVEGAERMGKNRSGPDVAGSHKDNAGGEPVGMR